MLVLVLGDPMQDRHKAPPVIHSSPCPYTPKETHLCKAGLAPALEVIVSHPHSENTGSRLSPENLDQILNFRVDIAEEVQLKHRIVVVSKTRRMAQYQVGIRMLLATAFYPRQ